MFELLSVIHWDVLIKIIMIDLILGVDNALVIAMAVSALSVDQRNKAVILGTAGAILARIAFLFIGFLLIGIPFVKVVAGAYLLYLGYSMVKGEGDDPSIKSKGTLLGAATTIVLADIMMSLDNVIALVGVSESAGNHSFAYTVFGILLSIPIIIFASKALIKLLDRFPILLWLGAALIAYVGASMMVTDQVLSPYIGEYTGGIISIGLTTIAMTIAWLRNRST